MLALLLLLLLLVVVLPLNGGLRSAGSPREAARSLPVYNPQTWDRAPGTRTRNQCGSCHVRSAGEGSLLIIIATSFPTFPSAVSRAALPLLLLRPPSHTHDQDPAAPRRPASSSMRLETTSPKQLRQVATCLENAEA